MNKTQTVAVVIDVILRLLGPLYVFVNPFWGCVVSVVLDGVDFEPLVRGFGLPKRTYDVLDKTLDFYWYILILVYVLLNETNTTLIGIVVVTFFWRLAGNLMLYIKKDNGVLVYFPNVVEPVFWLWLIWPTVFYSWWLLPVLMIVILLKIKNEIMLHRDGYNTRDYVTGLYLKTIKYVKENTVK